MLPTPHGDDCEIAQASVQGMSGFFGPHRKAAPPAGGGSAVPVKDPSDAMFSVVCSLF
jgi:hypothetical protein